jgi:hypothetical protein
VAHKEDMTIVLRFFGNKNQKKREFFEYLNVEVRRM